mgnify:FL=1
MTSQRVGLMGTHANGLALPTVLALCTVCSVCLLAGWRQILLAQGWGQAHSQRWQLQQAALTALAEWVHTVTSPEASNNPSLPAQGCRMGRCRSLLAQGNQTNDWVSRIPQAQTRNDVPGLRIHTWVEIWPTATVLATPISTTAPMPQSQSLTYRFTVLAQSTTLPITSAWQAVWQSPTRSSASPTAVRLADMHRILALQP